MKWWLLGIIGLLLVGTVSAAGQSLFTDYFNRADSTVVDTGWTEWINGDANISNNKLNIPYLETDTFEGVTYTWNLSSALDATYRWRTEYIAAVGSSLKPTFAILNSTSITSTSEISASESHGVAFRLWADQCHIIQIDGSCSFCDGASNLAPFPLIQNDVVYNFKATLINRGNFNHVNISLSGWIEGDAEGSMCYFEDPDYNMSYLGSSVNMLFASRSPTPNTLIDARAAFWDFEVNRTDPYNSAPFFINESVVPVAPNLSDVLFAAFTPDDWQGDNVNVSITWWKNHSNTISAVTTYDTNFTNVIIGRQENTSLSSGSVMEALTQDDEWWATLTAVDNNSNSVSINTSRVLIGGQADNTIFFDQFGYPDGNVSFNISEPTYPAGWIGGLGIIGSPSNPVTQDVRFNNEELFLGPNEPGVSHHAERASNSSELINTQWQARISSTCISCNIRKPVISEILNTTSLDSNTWAGNYENYPQFIVMYGNRTLMNQSTWYDFKTLMQEVAGPRMVNITQIITTLGGSEGDVLYRDYFTDLSGYVAPGSFLKMALYDDYINYVTDTGTTEYDYLLITTSNPSYTMPYITRQNIYPSIEVNGSGPVWSNSLNCNFTAYELSGNTTNVAVTWWKTNSSGEFNINDYDYTFNAVTLNQSYDTEIGTGQVAEQLQLGDQWKCQLTPSDGDGIGDIIYSSIVTITNGAPVMASSAITPSIQDTSNDPTGADNLDCKFNATDPDGDAVNVAVTWWKTNSSGEFNINDYDYTFNAVTLNSTTQTGAGTGRVTETLVKDDQWKCALGMSDPYGTIYQNTSLITVQNYPLTLSDATQSASAAVAGSDIDFSINCTGNLSAVSAMYLQSTSPLPSSANISMTYSDVGIYNGTATLSVVGTYSFDFFCLDTFGNFGQYGTPLHVNSQFAGGGGGAGPGGGSQTIIQNTSTVLGAFCGNNVCDEGENPGVCLEDCPLNIDRVFTCVITDPKSCADTGWFTTALFVFLGGILVWIMTGRKKRTEARRN